MAILVCPPREENGEEAGGLWEMKACVRTRGFWKGEACACLRDAIVQSSTVRLVQRAKGLSMKSDCDSARGRSAVEAAQAARV